MPDPITSALGRRVRARRTARGLTQAYVAEAVGVDPVTVRRWELGLRMPTRSNLARLAQLFGIPPVELWREALGRDDTAAQDGEARRE